MYKYNCIHTWYNVYIYICILCNTYIYIYYVYIYCTSLDILAMLPTPGWHCSKPLIYIYIKLNGSCCSTPALSWSCSELLCCLFIFCFESWCGVCARVSHGRCGGFALGGECTCRAPGPACGTRSRGLSCAGDGCGGARGSSIGMRKLSRQLTLLTAWWSGGPVTPSAITI